MNVDPAFWRGKRVLVTGHTGFKGGWLSLWLQELGAQLHGFALAPEGEYRLFDAARVGDGMGSTIADVRDLQALRAAVATFAPEIVIHLAAQPLVRQSYADPVGTYATNVMGTVHLLESVRATPSVRAVVVVTTDKCYENDGRALGYREDAPMGGHDPYSSSKGCAELVASAYRRSFFSPGAAAIASARAGNVIGGGDWGTDRLVPDILRAFERGEAVMIRHPHATRPWQHVLEPLSGYLVLAQRLWHDGAAFADGWNFGPRDADAWPVQRVVEHLAARWGGDARWQPDAGVHPHEASFLKLDIAKADARLGWTPRWHLDAALARVVDWQRAWRDGADARSLCLQQISDYTRAQA